jgi:toxin ParE1/3/4
MRHLIRSAQSEEDQIAIWRYVSKDNLSAARRLLERFDERINSLPDNPEVGEQQPQFGELTRRLIVGNYLIFYDVLPDAIHILRVFHAARKLEDLFG